MAGRGINIRENQPPSCTVGVAIFLRDCIQNNSVPIPCSGPCANLPSSRFNYDLICKIDDSYFHERAIPIRITTALQSHDVPVRISSLLPVRLRSMSS